MRSVPAQFKASSPRRGTVMIMAVVMLVALMAFVSLSVDWGRVQLAKTELEGAVNVASRAGGQQLGNGISAVQTAAISAAAANKVDSTALVITAADIDFLTWNSTTRTGVVLSGAARTSANAVRVHGQRTVPLMWASIFGRNSAVVNSTAVATGSDSPRGLIGLDGVDFKNNGLIASYNSTVTTNPTSSNANSAAVLASNAAVAGGNNTSVHGDVLLGPAGSDSITQTGTSSTRSSALPRPTDPAWSPTANPGGVAQAYSASGNVTLAAGTYWFTSLSVSGTLQFSGPATLYINGDATISGTLQPYQSIPANLTIYMIGTRTFGSSGSGDVTAVLVGPNSALDYKNNAVFRGSAYMDTITFKNNAEVYYDEALGTAGSRVLVTSVQ